MKTIWIILLFMVLFNGFLLTFNAFFPNSPYTSSQGKQVITDPTQDATLKQYNGPSSGVIVSLIGNGVALGSFIFGIALTLWQKNLIYLGACGTITLVTELWTQASRIFGNLMNYNPVVAGIYTMISIGMGIVCAILILGMFTSQDQTVY